MIQMTLSMQLECTDLGSASESTLLSLLAAREIAVRKQKEIHPEQEEGLIRAKLVAYSSDQSNSSVEKAGVLGAVIMRLLPSDDKCRLKAITLKEAIRSDKEKGLIPFFMVANLGTTGTCGFDSLEELGPICTEEGIWMHIDAAYAGAAFVCPEFRYLMSGVHHAQSFCFNPHKWFLINFECSAYWVKDSSCLVEAFNVDRIYLRPKNQGLTPDYRHWQIPLGRRFRSLKVWLVLRSYGVKGLQDHIHHQVGLAHEFEALVRQDDRFEIVTDVILALVCFRLKGPDELTKRLHDRLLARKNIYVIPATFQGQFIIRFVICARTTESKDITFAWDEIRSQVEPILNGKELDSDRQQPHNHVIHSKIQEEAVAINADGEDHTASTLVNRNNVNRQKLLLFDNSVNGCSEDDRRKITFNESHQITENISSNASKIYKAMNGDTPAIAKDANGIVKRCNLKPVEDHNDGTERQKHFTTKRQNGALNGIHEYHLKEESEKIEIPSSETHNRTSGFSHHENGVSSICGKTHFNGDCMKLKHEHFLVTKSHKCASNGHINGNETNEEVFNKCSINGEKHMYGNNGGDYKIIACKNHNFVHNGAKVFHKRNSVRENNREINHKGDQNTEDENTYLTSEKSNASPVIHDVNSSMEKKGESFLNGISFNNGTKYAVAGNGSFLSRKRKHNHDHKVNTDNVLKVCTNDDIINIKKRELLADKFVSRNYEGEEGTL